MSGFLANLIESVQDFAERHRNRPFLEGSMAACALVAMADGDVSFGERVRVDQILQTLEALQVYDPHEGVDLFNGFADGIAQDAEEGRKQALAAVEAAAETPADADLLIRLCLAVSEAKGEVALVDQIEIVMLCSVVGVDPAVYGLYREGTV